MAAMALAGPTLTRNSLLAQFQHFKKTHSRKYASPAEESLRFKYFVENMQTAAKMSARNPLAKFGVNEYSDMSAAEFKSRHNGNAYYAKVAAESKHNIDHTAVSAESMRAAAGRKQDWRPKGAVTPIKNQGQCGSCWSFSSTGSIEGQWFLAGNPLTSLSEQELVSCDTIDSGCQGGLMDNAWTWLMQAHNGSIVTEASYPYVSGGGEVPACSMSGTQFGAQISGYANIAKNETAMGGFVFTSGPMSVAVDATSWQTYVGGILTDCISNQIDHGVLVVGFDDTNQPPYWIIKNSWGEGWGEDGYIRVEKGTDQCLITSYPCTSKVTAGPAPTTTATTTAGPAPAGTEFEQKTCFDPKCSNCTSVRLPQNQCITSGSFSYTATCVSDALMISTYPTRKCTGTATVTSNPIDQCLVHFSKSRSDEFILNNCNPKAPTTTTTQAPTTTAAPTATFTQMQCQDTACSVGCQNATFQQNVCLGLNGGGSAIAVCNAQGLLLTEYPLSTSCTGMSIPSVMAVNTCEQMNGGGSLENFCPSSSTTTATFVRGAKMATTKAAAQRSTLLKARLRRHQ